LEDGLQEKELKESCCARGIRLYTTIKKSPLEEKREKIARDREEK
jgi:hypothetical protein